MSTTPFPTPDEARKAAMERIQNDPRTAALRTEIMQRLGAAAGRQFTVNTASIPTEIVTVVTDELRQSGWRVSRDSDGRNGSHILVEPSGVDPGRSQADHAGAWRPRYPIADQVR